MTDLTAAEDVPLQTPPQEPDSAWRSRIVGHGVEDPQQLLANPRNWRIHPRRQQDALTQALDEVGWVRDVLVNQRTGHVVDGHLRVGLAITKGEEAVPVTYVDLSEEEEKLVLATIDPLGSLAVQDDGALKGLLGDLEGDLQGDLAQMLSELTKGKGSAAPQTPTQEEIDAQADKREEGYGDAHSEVLDVTCPHCGEEFGVNKAELLR